VAYAIERHEQVPAAVRRIMDEQIVRAREQLTDAATPVAKRVHDARKRFKETRALLRLIGVENTWFRDAGRELAAARDAEAVLEALATLELERAVRARVKRQLAKPGSEDLDARVTNVLAQLVVAQARIETWPEIEDSFDAIAAGLERAYRGGRRAMKGARTDAQMHEWRKRVKEHWYHVQLLRHAWPEMMKAYAGVLEELSHALGDHHDLAVLRAGVASPPEAFVFAVDARQREQERRAREIGSRVYAERPRTWSARMRKVWDAWRTS
jgi:CHAD domain-containing protein